MIDWWLTETDRFNKIFVASSKALDRPFPLKIWITIRHGIYTTSTSFSPTHQLKMTMDSPLWSLSINSSKMPITPAVFDCRPAVPGWPVRILHCKNTCTCVISHVQEVQLAEVRPRTCWRKSGHCSKHHAQVVSYTVELGHDLVDSTTACIGRINVNVYFDDS